MTKNRQTGHKETRRGTDESQSADDSVEISQHGIPHVLGLKGDPAAAEYSG